MSILSNSIMQHFYSANIKDCWWQLRLCGDIGGCHWSFGVGPMGILGHLGLPETVELVGDSGGTV